MAEIKTARLLRAGNGVRAYFTKYGSPTEALSDGDCLFLSGSWPLAEFDELVKFVQEHRFPLQEVDMKLSELNDPDEVQTDG